MEAGVGEEDRLFELRPGEVTAAERLEEGSSPRQEQGRGGWLSALDAAREGDAMEGSVRPAALASSNMARRSWAPCCWRQWESCSRGEEGRKKVRGDAHGAVLLPSAMELGAESTQGGGAELPAAHRVEEEDREKKKKKVVARGVGE
jgi:hypothetical protein